MDKYKPTIGLEIHAELKTLTKMFCNSKNDADEERPNVNICPICMAHPGTLPVINKAAVKHVVRVGTAVGATIADFTEFDRKNYFYPDIPKNYQISQYKYPIVSGGSINGIQITRVHLEEDTARSLHDQGEGSIIDYNRAGVPLMELVTEPVIHDAGTAVAFAKELQLLLRTLGASDANLEKGEMRVEANISVSKDDTLGTKVEVKNLNSFKSVEKAILFEIDRHSKALEKGEKLVQETRGWDEAKQITFSQRKKESSHDYRYFPDPDLPKLKLSEIEEFSKENIKKELPELPSEKRARLVVLGLQETVAETLVSNTELGSLFDISVKNLNANKEITKLIADYITSDLAGLLKTGAKIPSNENFAALMKLRAENKITTRVTKDVLIEMVKEDNIPEKIIEKLGLSAGSADELKSIVSKIVADNPKAVQEYKAGKEASLQFLIGQVMRVTKGSADPGTLKNILLEDLKKSH